MEYALLTTFAACFGGLVILGAAAAWLWQQWG